MHALINTLNRKMRLLFFGVLSFSMFLVASILFGGQVDALSGSQFQAGRIIDDAIFYNNAAMSQSQIQHFLSSKVPVCDTWGTKPHGGTTRANYAASKGVSTPFICLKDYTQAVPAVTNSGSDLCGGSISAGTKSAAQIIYEVSQACGVNPQIMIVLLQKEQSLITDDWPWPIQYRSATGYGCPDTAPCDAEFYGFFNQVYQAAKAYKRYRANPTNYNYRAGRNNTILWHPNTACGSSSVYIHNQATAGLYTYTPYQPNQAALNNLYGTGDSCSSYGNRNFWRMFNDWFGTTEAFVRDGVNYSGVFDPEYYTNTYPDIQAAFGDNQALAFWHFAYFGLYEGRQGNAEFKVNSYRTRYADLRKAFGNNLHSYVWHYVYFGKAEGRMAIGDYRGGTTFYKGVNYAPVYSFDYYTRTYPDIWNAFGLNDEAALAHFAVYGLKEGRLGSNDFSIKSYRTRYADLRKAFGNNLQSYVWHYVYYGRNEGRIATGDYRGGGTLYNGIDYSLVYNFDYYTRKYPDIWNAFGLNDEAALWHFANYGLYEGRMGNPDFSITAYKNNNPDLQAAFGNNLQSYVWHYAYFGRYENRVIL